MTTNICSNLDSALKGLTIKGPYGFTLKSYRNSKGENRVYVDIIKGPYKNLDDLADEIEKFLPKHFIPTIRDNRIYILCENLPNKIKYTVTNWGEDD